jgi:hypothetical protein
VLLGFSYGGSLALVAAADERVAGCIDLVATFGAYADLIGVLQAAVTGVSVVNGKDYPWHSADESIVRTMLHDAATRLVPENEREPLRRALEQQDPRGLAGAAHLVYRMVTTDDPALVADLARRLPPPGDALVETFSPVAVADRLHAAFPQAEVMTVRSFEHVDLSTGDGLGPLVSDLLTAWTFMQAVLRPQEEWP